MLCLNKTMKVKILNPYFDKKLKKDVKLGEVLDIEESRIKELEKVGIFTEKVKEDKKDLIELFNNDRNIVDELNVKELKQLCKDLDVKFTNEAEIKEHLKTMEVLEDK